VSPTIAASQPVSIQGHVDALKNTQVGLRNRLGDFNNLGCARKGYRTPRDVYYQANRAPTLPRGVGIKNGRVFRNAPAFRAPRFGRFPPIMGGGGGGVAEYTK